MMKHSLPLLLLLLCPLSQAYADPVQLAYDYEAEHAEIARLVLEMDYLSQQAELFASRYHDDAKPLSFNYERLVQILNAESAEIRRFLNLKYQAPNITAGAE